MMMSKDEYNREIKRFMKSAKSFLSYYSDDQPGKVIETEIAQRDKKYSALLSSYVQITSVRNVLKEIHKWLFFWLVIIASGICLSLVYNVITSILDSNDPEFIISSIPAIITALVSFVTAIIGIPMTITSFLFNTKEDDNITELIKHTQDHDAGSITMFKERFLSQAKQNDSNENNHQGVDSDAI